MYAYHFIVLFLLSLALKDYVGYVQNETFRRILMFSVGIGGTILVSHLSYKYIESWFLKKKEKFMLIKSRSSGSAKSLYVTDPELSELKVAVRTVTTSESK